MPKLRPKRISGTGYTRGEASQLLYKRQSADGKTYEIDTDAIAQVIDAYIASKCDDTGQITQPISRPAMCKALGDGAGRRPISPDTYRLWLDGYVNADHRTDDAYVSNDALSAAVRAGETAYHIYLLETREKYGETMRIRQAETAGAIAPAKQQQDVNVNLKLGKWRKYAQ